MNKSFNRGFTKYFLYGRNSKDIWSIKSPKSIGEPIGTVVEAANRYLRIKTDKKLNNGDGICFFNSADELVGFQINKIENSLIYPNDKVNILKGTEIFRNFDHAFEKQLQQNNTAERKIIVNINISETDNGFSIQAVDEDDNIVILDFDAEKELAKSDQTQNIVNNLSKTGNTIFKVEGVKIIFSESWFIPASVLSDWKRQVMDALHKTRMRNYKREESPLKQTSHPFPSNSITYLGNVMNQKAKQFYVQHQSKVLQPAFEKQAIDNVPLMFTRHCVKYSLGWCPKEGNEKHPYKEPFYMTYKDTRLKLVFDCKFCEMKVYNATK